MQEGWRERVGGRAMFREKPRQLTDVGSTAEPPCPQPFPPPLPQKKGVEKNVPSSKHIAMQALEYERLMAGITNTVNNDRQIQLISN